MDRSSFPAIRFYLTFEETESFQREIIVDKIELI